MSPCERRRSTGQASLLPCVVPAPAAAPAVGLPVPPPQPRRASNDAETRNLLVDLKLQLAEALQKVDELSQANKRLVKERDEARVEVALLKKQHEERPCTCTKEGPTAVHVADGDGTKSPTSVTIPSDTARGKFDPSLGYGSSNIRGPSTTSTAGPLEALGGAASVRNMFSSLRRESLMTTTTESSRTQASRKSRRQNSHSSLLEVQEKHESNNRGVNDDQDGPIWLQKLRNLPGSSTKDLSCRDDGNMVTNNLTGHKRERMPRRGSSSAPNILSISPSALAHFNESTLNLMALDDMSESMNNILGKDQPPDSLPSYIAAACGAEFTAPLSAAKNSAVPLKRNNTENDVKSFMRRMSGLSDDFSISDDDSFGGDYKNAEWTELP